MPIRRLSFAVSPLLRFADWLFSGEASGADLFYMAVSSWWLYLMLCKPAVFDTGSLAGMDWAPDAFWMVFVSTVILLHAVALWRPRMYRMRMVAALVSAWYWITVAASISKFGVVPGTGAYSIWGFGAVMLAVYLSGRGTHRA